MLKKEISEVLKQILFFILVIIVVPEFLIITTIVSDTTYFRVFFPALQVSLLFWSMFMGISLFSTDRGQKGMEYLLSLPYSRLKIIVFKVLPRLAAVFIFFLVFLIIYRNGGEDAAALSLISFSIIYFSIFLISLSLSISSENFIFLFVISSFSVLIYLGLLFLAYWTAWRIKDIPYYELDIPPFFTGGLDPDIAGLLLLAAFFLLLPPLVSFILSFRKFDVRPTKVFNRRHLKFFIPLFILGFMTSSFSAYKGIHVGRKYYYLTQNHRLIESSPYSDTKIYEGKKVYKIKKEFDFSWPFMEEKEYVYDSSDNKIFRLNTSSYATEVLYEAPPGRHWKAWQIWKYEKTIAFIEDNILGYHNKQLVLVDETSKRIRKIPLDYQPLRYYPNHLIFGTDKRDGKRFWLIYNWGAWKDKEKPILRLWEDGRVEKLGKSLNRPCYINQMLIASREKEVIISKENRRGFETIKKIPNSRGFRFGIGLYFFKSLKNFPLKELYGWSRDRKLARLDIESFEIEEIGKFKGWPFRLYAGNCYIDEFDEAASVLKIYRLKEGKPNLIKAFNLDYTKLDHSYFFCPGGVVIRKGRKLKAYAFPDLEELKFKKL